MIIKCYSQAIILPYGFLCVLSLQKISKSLSASCKKFVSSSFYWCDVLDFFGYLVKPLKFCISWWILCAILSIWTKLYTKSTCSFATIQAVSNFLKWLKLSKPSNHLSFGWQQPWRKTIRTLKNFSISQLFAMLDLDFFLVSMLLQKQRNLCLRLQYILCLQYNKQWYQIACQIYCQIFFLLELQVFELLIAFLIPIFLIL